jgi:tungstate transport system substrate-binding protein
LARKEDGDQDVVWPLVADVQSPHSGFPKEEDLIPTNGPRLATLAFVVFLVSFLTACGETGGSRDSPERRDILLATTTSTQDSGLLDELLPLFEEQTGYRVKTIAVGTGEALAMGSRGDADVLLAHAPAREKEMVAAGFVVRRRLVMHNDFLIVGPPRDPAGIRGLEAGADAVRKIAARGALFASRGDDSGTHIREMSLWEAAGVAPGGHWYLSTGQGMGATLMIAGEMGAYVLTDRGTYLPLQDRVDLVPHVEGDRAFLNIYSVMEVNPQRFPKVNSEGAKAFADFLLGPQAQEIIGGFGIESFGQPLFLPDAGKSEESLSG